MPVSKASLNLTDLDNSCSDKNTRKKFSFGFFSWLIMIPKIMIEKPRFVNRLINQKSPYLLQHAHNPVDWFPWGNEAFKTAKEQDKPIFLSIGYATCHWCHVMEKESFENVSIAQQMNENFVNIKVDREELPEIDSLYMEFAQSMMSGSAGWPLNLILTPDLEPFFAATYLPPLSKHGLMGLFDLIERIAQIWSSEEKERIFEQASKIVELFSGNIHTRGDELPPKESIEKLREVLYKLADPVYGGLKGSPKFPIGYQETFLIRSKQDSRSIFLAERTLDMMQRGGIYDHIGGGFSRYSVDEEWLQPHFEKMLYDNALLIDTYNEAYLATHKPFYKEVACHIADYLLRDMRHPEGGFYSAEDADSEGYEGRFYVWKKDEILGLLGSKKGEIFCRYYGVTEEGNFEGYSILHTKLRVPEFCQAEDLPVDEVENILSEGRNLLFKAREERIHPLKDDKILASWNGLICASLASLGFSTGNDRYTRAAKSGIDFIKNKLWKNGKLLRRYRDGQSDISGQLDEYAFMIRACLRLFETDCGTEYLDWALELNKVIDRKFKLEGGAYFQTDGEDSSVIIRKCQYSDGAEPSGNAIQTENLIKLYRLTGDDDFMADAEEVLKAVKKYLESYPPGYCYHVMNLTNFYDSNSPTLVVALNEREDHITEIKKLLVRNYNPSRTVIFKRINDEIPFVKSKDPINGETTLYVCRQGVCEAPTLKFEEAILKA